MVTTRFHFLHNKLYLLQTFSTVKSLNRVSSMQLVDVWCTSGTATVWLDSIATNIFTCVLRNVYLLVRVVGTPTLSKPSRGCQRICLIPTLHIAVVNGKHNGQTEFFL